MLEVLNLSNVSIIDTANIKGLIVDAEFAIDESSVEYDELIRRGITVEDLEDLNVFLYDNQLIMVSLDEINGVSFDNCLFSNDLLYESDLWKDKEE